MISSPAKIVKKSLSSPYLEYDQRDLTLLENSPSYGANTSKSYVFKIKDRPTYERPREKMKELGPSSLSLVELLSIVLVSGTKKEDVMSMASRVVYEYGKSALSSTDRNVDQLAADLEIPFVKACQIIAAGELGRRLFNKNLSGLAVIRTPEDVYEYVKDMHTLSKEQLRGLYLDTHHKVIHDEILSIGTINASMVHPREVFKPAIEYGAAAIVLVHNHPSGVHVPSDSDKNITEQIVQAGKVLGISVLDHLIVTRNGFASVPINYQ